MNYFFSILESSSSLLLASLGGLVSEYVGQMAIFLDGIINLSAFLCFAFTITTKSAILGITLSILSCMSLVFVADYFTQKFHANPFLTSLALNLFSSALATALSAQWFGTRGILTSPLFSFDAEQARLYSTISALVLTGTGWILLKRTKIGLYIRITGSNPDVLEYKGINPQNCIMTARLAAAFYASCAGCILPFTLSSYVPNISSGRGWTALAVVFLGRKNTAAVFAAVFVFAAAQYAANNIQNITGSVTPALLISLPYIVALLLIFVLPRHMKD